MRIGIPTEIKAEEGRVALTPEACQMLVHQSHEVVMQTGAGLNSGYSDAEYQAVGVTILPNPKDVYGDCDLLVKVKEPQPHEVEWFKPGQLLFCYLHLAALPELTDALLESGVTALGFEIVKVDNRLPLLSPMSHVAGRLAVQTATQLLHSTRGGKGLLLGGVDGTDPGHAVVIGAGEAGMAAARDLLCSGAKVTLLDINAERLAAMKDEHPALHTLNSRDPDVVRTVVANADVLIGAALVAGRKAPVVVTREMVRDMPDGGAIVDIAIDQGGCIETSRPTSYDNPVYVDEGMLHFCVTNMPGAVPRTSTQALSHVITPYVAQIASGQITDDRVLQGAIYLEGGEIQYAGLK
ncbi:MAG: alanine dehydrogenase [Gammaproteobacteria bacterium]|nr:alanine dehydrogenase [Gammaproteobacteria bacterium]